MNNKKPTNLAKMIRKTIFYLFVTTLGAGILVPVFFLVSLSFLSTREAYQFPLPLLPSWSTNYSLTHGDRGYLLSVYDNFENEYQTVLDTNDLEKMSVYMRSQIGAPYAIPDIEDRIAELESGIDPVNFKARKNLLLNYDTFLRLPVMQSLP